MKIETFERQVQTQPTFSFYLATHCVKFDYLMFQKVKKCVGCNCYRCCLIIQQYCRHSAPQIASLLLSIITQSQQQAQMSHLNLKSVDLTLQVIAVSQMSIQGKHLQICLEITLQKPFYNFRSCLMIIIFRHFLFFVLCTSMIKMQTGTASSCMTFNCAALP